jgi:hypothetical protein
MSHIWFIASDSLAWYNTVKILLEKVDWWFWMNKEYGPRELKTAVQYMPDALKFYQLKNESVSRILFVFILLISFVSVFTDSAGGNLTRNIIISLVVYVVINLASSIYLYAYINDLKGKEYTFSGCLHSILKQSPKIIAVSLLFVTSIYMVINISVIPGLSLLIIPVFALYIMFVFVMSYIVDLHEGLVGAFIASKNLTKGKMGKIFKVFFVFVGILVLPVFLLSAAASGASNVLVIYFIIYFITTVTNFMQQRLTALMYMDLEYGQPKTLPKDQNNTYS